MGDKREFFIAKIGPLLRKILDTQRENIKKETYEICESSDWEAGEIIAKKILDNKLL